MQTLTIQIAFVNVGSERSSNPSWAGQTDRGRWFAFGRSVECSKIFIPECPHTPPLMLPRQLDAPNRCLATPAAIVEDRFIFGSFFIIDYHWVALPTVYEWEDTVVSLFSTVSDQNQTDLARKRL